MSVVAVELKGFAALKHDLATLSNRVANRVVDEALEAGAEIIATEARNTAPVDEGRMAESIAVAKSKFNRKGKRAFIVKTGTREELGIDPKDKYYYPAAVEFGYTQHNQITGKLTVNPPNPFMRRAADSVGPEAQRVATDMIKQGIELEAAAKR